MYKYVRSSDDRRQMFERKAKYAENKAKSNIEIAVEHGMTNEQADAVAQICKYRHDIHMTKGADVYYGNDHIYEIITKIDDILFDNSLPEIRWTVNTDTDWITDADYENNLIDDDIISMLESEAKSTSRDMSDVIFEYADAYNTKTIDSINKDIEAWLTSVDEQYGTEFAPSGWSRLM